MNSNLYEAPGYDPYDDYPRGVFFTNLLLLFTGTALFLALLYSQGSLVIFSLIVLLLGVVIRAWSRFSPRNLDYSAVAERTRVFPGERVGLTFQVENNKFLPILLKLRMSVIGVHSPGRQEMILSENTGLLWYQKLEINRSFSPARRGVYKAGSPDLITGDLFGFIPRMKAVKHDVDIIVYPRIVALKPFPILKKILFGKPASTSPVQDPVYVLGTREYRNLSPARHIHWKASARHNRLQEKIFEPSEQEKVLLILDGDGFYHNGKMDLFEKTVELIASLAVLLDSQHHAVGLLTNCGSIGADRSYLPMKRGPGHIPDFLETLARIEARPHVNMERLLEQKHHFPTGVSCIYFSFRADAGFHLLHYQRNPVIRILADSEVPTGSEPEAQESNAPCFHLQDIRLEH